MRWIFAAAALVAALCFDVPASHAYSGNAPWCAVISVGTGSVVEQCYYRTLEECVPNVLAGNRGWCNPNFRLEGTYAPAKSRRKHHAQQH